MSEESPPLTGILEFLQEGLDKGLSPDTLKVQVTALSAAIGFFLSKGTTDQKIPESSNKDKTSSSPVFQSRSTVGFVCGLGRTMWPSF